MLFFIKKERLAYDFRDLGYRENKIVRVMFISPSPFCTLTELTYTFCCFISFEPVLFCFSYLDFDLKKKKTPHFSSSLLGDVIFQRS